MANTRSSQDSVSTAPHALLICALLHGVLAAHCGDMPPPDDALTDPATLQSRVLERLETLQSGRFEVISEVYAGDVRGANLRQVVLVRQPEDLHMQVLSPFGQALQILVSDGQTLSLYDLEQQTFFTGAPSPTNLAHLMPFYLTAGDIVRVFLGAPPLDLFDPDPQTHELSWDSDEGFYRLRVPLILGTGHLELGIRHGDWTLAHAEQYDAEDVLVFELRAGTFESVGDAMLPHQLRFIMAARATEGDQESEGFAATGVDLSIEVESAELNVDLPDTLFVLEAPSGVDVIELD